MFQYAAGLFYAAQYSAQMIVLADHPHNAVSHGHPRPFLLRHFAITAPCRDQSTFDRLVFRTDSERLKPALGPMLQKHLLGDALRVQIISEGIDQRFRFQSRLPIEPKTRRVYLQGYWQVSVIPERLSDVLRREFAFRDAPSGRNLAILRSINAAENPVSIHLRRGDYTHPAEGDIALSMDYYSRAISRIQTVLADPTFFVFSDDVDFARRNLDRSIHAVFVDHNDSFSAHEDMRLMSCCRHHIIANSTFSWWGAWLNRSAEKMVIAPRNWRVANCPADNDLLPSSWILVE